MPNCEASDELAMGVGLPGQTPSARGYVFLPVAEIEEKTGHSSASLQHTIDESGYPVCSERLGGNFKRSTGAVKKDETHASAIYEQKNYI